MKIWNEIGSSHSTDVTVIGEFENQRDAEIVVPMLKDLIAGIENGMNDIKDFYNKWGDKIPVEGIYLSKHEFNDDVEASIDVELDGNIVKVNAYKVSEFTGIIKLMFMCKSKNIQFSGSPI